MAHALAHAPGGRPVAIVSSSSERGGQFARDYGLRSFGSLEALLANGRVDAVYISTRNATHAPLALTAIGAGKHVLCEKPLATSERDAQAMIEAADAAGVVLAVDHHLRCAPATRTVRDLVATGVIGAVLSARLFHGTYLPQELRTWRLSASEPGAGAALDLTTHSADLLRFVVDAEVVEVMATTAQHGVSTGSIEDTIVGTWRFRNGLLASFHDSFALPGAVTSLELHGERGSLFVRDALADDPVATVTLRTGGKERVVETGPARNLYVETVSRVNDAIAGRGSPAANGRDGLISLSVALASLRAARQRAVQVVQ
jgi:1,5-anhydro-D-fructose reductase (1,5-anhydro-D-mannitol-forming)